ncbi:hypothetical protein NK8_32030 [Caballeronia sp. NK8]|jgi:hypothetical protein|uniref:hypothetical protein n=1 Tax=Caballeronia sp. NK8 TaxID=140098 RepID=UPI001BB5ADF2|nr:hypothetical protein [Caballeronia sp. NK8]BCQ25026.1 hypothetical protein NK8_32030 [Caballeronia sp. NK8]
MTFWSEMRRVADALARTFAINPPTDYRSAYPRRSAAEMMDRAWARTMSELNGTIEGYGQNERRR